LKLDKAGKELKKVYAKGIELSKLTEEQNKSVFEEILIKLYAIFPKIFSDEKAMQQIYNKVEYIVDYINLKKSNIFLNVTTLLTTLVIVIIFIIAGFGVVFMNPRVKIIVNEQGKYLERYLLNRLSSKVLLNENNKLHGIQTTFEYIESNSYIDSSAEYNNGILISDIIYFGPDAEITSKYILEDHKIIHAVVFTPNGIETNKISMWNRFLLSRKANMNSKEYVADNYKYDDEPGQ
jgi:hypothetical protein